MLAIAAPSFDMPSETFIRDHVRILSPRKTVLLCRDLDGSEVFGLPVLSGFTSWRRPKAHRYTVATVLRSVWRNYIDAGLSAADRGRVLSFLSFHHPKAVLAEYGVTGCIFMQTCEEAGVPLYVHFHGYDASSLIRRWEWRRRYQRLFRKSAGIIVPSHALGANLLAAGCAGDKLHVVPCGVNPQRFLPTRRVPQRILAVGRLVEKKAPHLMIAAFSRIVKDYPLARLEIIGDGPLVGRCRDAIDNLGLQGRVRMHGIQSPAFVAQRMQEASLFIQHSVTAVNGDSEGLPVALLEAMASALPVVATRHGGIPEAIEDGSCGTLVEEHDIKGMAIAIAEMLSDPVRAAAMGAAGRRRVLAQFTQDKTRDRLRRIMGLPPLD